MKMTQNKKIITILKLLIFVGIFLIWESLVRFKIVSHLALAAPSEVFPLLISRYDLFWKHFLITMQEISLGFLCAVILATLLATIIVHSELLADILYPYIIGLNSTAKVAIAPLILLIFGYGLRPVIAIVTLIAFLPLTINMITGLKSVNRDLLDLMRIYRASKWQVFTKVRFPSSLPYVFSGLRISAVLSVKGAVIGEVFQSTDRGLGFLITQGDLYFEVGMVYGAAIIACLIGIVFFILITLLERKILYWHESRANFSPPSL